MNTTGYLFRVTPAAPDPRVGYLFILGVPLPTVGSLTPATAALGAAAFTLHVIGTGFTAGSVIQRNGGDVPTTFVSATELTTPVSMAGAVVGPVPVSVRTGDYLVSNAVNFTVTATE